ncbi:nucleotide sugar dehydrogenase [Listeria booriae]|uniref:nucleotide sugar dehydrogenase n=1 Tax=Listeria booriae TaxID=1552123 RepID=UPI001623868A|nr:nucleotide sugar dehydrogenase [Listeria booriae]MBC1233436.1 nucleotide sugar dehydrogenase [Listeria booriae]MBC1245754.1 nucleotide sugar dehydrogenase [Listeria booriae]
MKITVLGLGYIGLPTAVMFANHKQDVYGVDVNPHVVNELSRGRVHIEEPGLQDALNKALQSETFHVGKEVTPSDVFIVSVPTPNNDDVLKSCNLDYVKSAVKMALTVLEQGNTIIVESTIAPRSMEDHVKPIIEEAGFQIGKDIFLVHCPERVLPGQVLHELIFNNRIIGGMTPACIQKGKEIYGIFVQGELIETTASAAEMSKLMENTYRDVNIALANELVKVCNELNIDALDVIDMANKHPRVNLHLPGPGVGGHCLAVDPYFIAAEAPTVSPLIQTARKINTSMPEFVIKKAEEALDFQYDKKIVVMGLTYKGDIDDIRESPAMEIYEQLAATSRYQVVAYDPHVKATFVEKDMETALHQADLVLILTDHSEFQTLHPKDFANTNHAHIIDTKNIAKDCYGYDGYHHLGNISEVGQTFVHA